MNQLPLTLLALLGAFSAPSLAATGSSDESAVAQLFADLHRINATEAGHSAHNFKQQLGFEFDGRGLLAAPDEEQWTWGLELLSAGGSPLVASPAVEVAAGRLAYRWSPSLTEWYINDGRGLEHGFTLESAPAGASSYTLELAVRGTLELAVLPGARDARFFDPAGVARLDYSNLMVFDATGRELDAFFSGHAGILRVQVDLEEASYPVTIDPLVHQSYIKASNTDAGDTFGSSVAIFGDTIVVGAPEERSSATGVNNGESINSFSSAGAVYVFRKTGGVWAQEAYLKASNTGSYDRFGTSVDIWKDALVVGAYTESGGGVGVGADQSDNSMVAAGAAFIFSRNGTTWSQDVYLKASNTGPGDQFGWAVAIEGDTLVVGAPQEDSAAIGSNGDQLDNSAPSAGAVYIFRNTGGSWAQEAYLKSSNTETLDNFGWDVDISGEFIVVGAKNEDSQSSGTNGDQTNNLAINSGAAYVFERTGSKWKQRVYLKASNPGPVDAFGISVAISGSTVVVGANGEDGNSGGVNGDQTSELASASGAAYVFKKSGTVWSQSAYLKAPMPYPGDRFGQAVAIDGGRIVIGAPKQNGSAYGVDGGPGYGPASGDSGAAFTFKYLGGQWQPGSYLKASTLGVNDQFGKAVAVYDQEYLVGAWLEDGDSSGLGGDPFSNTAIDSGAVELFDFGASCGLERYGVLGGANVADLFSAGMPNEGATFDLSLSGFAADGGGLVAISGAAASVPLLGGTLLVDLNPALVTLVPIVVAGGSASLSLAIPVGTAGVTVYAQGVAVDPAQPSGFAWTTGVAATICP